MTVRAGPGSASRAPRSGVTLLEILVVIVILSMILGLSLGILRNANKDLGVMAAANTVSSMLRAAAEHARAENAPAWVVLDMNERSIGALTRETIGMWHFEDTTGAFGKDIKVSGAVQDKGRVGLAYRFNGPHFIDCGEVLVYRPDQGMAIEMWFYRFPGTGKHILASIGNDMEVWADPVGRVHVRVGNVTANSETHLIPRESWIYLQAVYNGREIKILLNGAEVGTKPCRHTWKSAAPLIVGSRKDGIAGYIDEVRLSLVVPHDTYALPPEVEFDLPKGSKVQDGEFIIAFDNAGRLDGARHPQELTLTLHSPVASRTIVVTRQGLIKR
ncbi:MAG TPA: LamG-like jellyroll fold domain-containing protein [Planctomycetota bacterium]|nr:LamG-like jellyroll fold domain-containing protein [Planctomycetota bacterium]